MGEVWTWKHEGRLQSPGMVSLGEGGGTGITMSGRTYRGQWLVDPS